MKQVARWITAFSLICTIAWAVVFICQQMGYMTTQVGDYTYLTMSIGVPLLDIVALTIAMTQIGD